MQNKHHTKNKALKKTLNILSTKLKGAFLNMCISALFFSKPDHQDRFDLLLWQQTADYCW